MYNQYTDTRWLIFIQLCVYTLHRTASSHHRTSHVTLHTCILQLQSRRRYRLSAILTDVYYSFSHS
jgi:hypothetical protein